MGLNFLGLGFSFGAKDMGLEKVQQKVTAGFQGMNVEIDRLHETTKPAFNYMTSAMDGVDAVLAKQEQRVGEWSQSFADAIDNVSAMPNEVTAAFDPLTQALKSGAESVAFTWDNTFGKSFSAVGQRFDQLQDRMGGIVSVAEPLTKKFRAVFEKGSDGIGLFKDALGGVASEFKKLWEDTEESESVVKQFTFFFQKRAANIAKAQQVISDGFGSIKDVVGKMNQLLRVNKLRGFMEAISVGMLAKIAGGIQKIGSEGMNLTTGLEAQMVGYAKASKQTAVNLGLTGKELRAVSSQASGLALGLNIGAESATQAIVGYNDASKEMAAVGLKSASDLAKLGEVAGVDGKQFGFMLKHMTKLGLGTEEIKKVVGSFTAMGQETRDVSGGLAAVGEIMAVVEKKAALMGEKIDPKQLAEFASGTAALAAGLGKMGHAADKARQISMGLAETIVENQKQLQNLAAGTADDLGNLPKELAIITGDLDKGFELMAQGPAGFTKGLQHMVKAAKSQGADVGAVMDFVRARLENAGVQGVEPLINFMRTADGDVLKMMDSVNDATKDLGALAKSGFSTGRTLQESFDLAKESAISHFRAGGKASATFLADFTKSATKFNKILDDTSKKGGPLGNFVDKLRDVHKLGAAGLLPKEMQGAGILLGEIVSQLGPLLGLLGGAVMFFPGLTAVLGPVVTVLGLFAINLFKAKLAGEDWATATQTAVKNTMATLSKFVSYLAAAIPKVVDAVTKALPGIIDAIMKAAPGILKSLGEIGTKLVDVVVEMAPKLVDAFLKVFDKIVDNWGKLYPKLIGLLTKIIEKVIAFLPTLIPKLVDMFGKVLDAVIEAIITLVPQLAKVIVEVIPTLVKGLADALPKIIDALVKLAPSLIEAFVGIIESLAESLPELLGKVIPAIIKGLETILTAILENAPKLMDALLSFIIGFVEKLPEMLPQLVTAFMNLLPKLITALSKVLVSLADALPKILPPLLDALVKGLLAIVDELPVLLPALTKGLIAVITALAKAMPKILPALMKAFTALIDGLVKALPVLIPVLVKGIIENITTLVPVLLKAFWEIAKQLANMLFGPDTIKMMGKLLLALVKGIWEALVDLVATYIIEPLADIWTLLEIPSLGDIFDGLKDAASEAWEFVTGLFDSITKPFKDLWGTIEPYVTDLLKGMLKVLLLPLMAAWLVLKKVFEKPFLALKKTAKMVIGFVTKLFKKLFSFVKKKWKDFSDAAQKAWTNLKAVWTNAKMKLTAIFTSIADAGKKIWKDIVKAAKNVWTDIQAAWGDVKQFFTDLFSGVKQAVETPFNELSAFVKGVWDDGAGGGIKGWWEQATGVFDRIFKAIAGSIRKAFSKIKEWLEEKLGPLKDLITLVDNLVEKVFRNSIHDDIKVSMDKSTDYIEEGSTAMTKTWSGALKLFYETGISRFKQIESATGRFAKAELEIFDDFFGKLKKSFEKAFSEMNVTSQGMTDNLKTAVDEVTKQMDGIARAFRTVRRAQGDVAAAREAAQRESEDAAKELKLVRTSQLRVVSDDAKGLIDAVHDPRWWKDGARTRMDNMVTELGLVVKATNSVVSAVKELKTVVGRRQVGGRAARAEEVGGSPRSVRA